MKSQKARVVLITLLLYFIFTTLFSGCSISPGAYRVGSFGFFDSRPSGRVRDVSSKFKISFDTSKDDKIFIFLSLLNRYLDKPIPVSLKLYDPEGRLYRVWEKEYTQFSEDSTATYRTFSISTRKISDRPGKWIVKAHVNNEQIGSESFTLRSPSPSQTPQSQPVKVKPVWTRASTTLYGRPDVAAPIRHQLPAGLTLRVYSSEPGWYFVASPNGWGWVQEKQVSESPSKNITPSPGQVAKTPKPNETSKVWTTQETPLTLGRYESWPPKDIIPAGTELEVYGSEPGWYFVQGPRGAGWVEKKRVSTTAPKASIELNKTYKLTVQAKPSDSTIRLLNIQPKYRPGIELKPGNYDILVEKEGYQQVRQQVTLRDSDITIPISLQRTESHTEIDVQKDTTPPKIIIRQPLLRTDKNRLTLNQNQLVIRGKVTDASGIFSILVNGTEASVSPQGEFTAQIKLLYGENSIHVKAVDRYNNIAEEMITIVRGTISASPTVPRLVRRRFALVIGNSQYENAHLRNPVNDATDVSTMLRELGFSVTLLRDASLKDMEKAISIFTGKLGEGDAGLFYFAGHGIQVRGENYLIPTDGQIVEEFDVKYQAVSANWLLDKMEHAGNALNIVILDACRDNPYARSWRSSQRGLAVVPAVEGALVAYATAPGKTAADGKGRNSPYTKHLLRLMPQPNMKVEELFKKVRIGVRRETKNRQTPWESSSLIGDFYFSTRQNP